MREKREQRWEFCTSSFPEPLTPLPLKVIRIWNLCQTAWSSESISLGFVRSDCVSAQYLQVSRESELQAAIRKKCVRHEGGGGGVKIPNERMRTDQGRGGEIPKVRRATIVSVCDVTRFSNGPWMPNRAKRLQNVEVVGGEKSTHSLFSRIEPKSVGWRTFFSHRTEECSMTHSQEKFSPPSVCGFGIHPLRSPETEVSKTAKSSESGSVRNPNWFNANHDSIWRILVDSKLSTGSTGSKYLNTPANLIRFNQVLKRVDTGWNQLFATRVLSQSPQFSILCFGYISASLNPEILHKLPRTCAVGRVSKGKPAHKGTIFRACGMFSQPNRHDHGLRVQSASEEYQKSKFWEWAKRCALREQFFFEWELNKTIWFATLVSERTRAEKPDWIQLTNERKKGPPIVKGDRGSKFWPSKFKGPKNCVSKFGGVTKFWPPKFNAQKNCPFLEGPKAIQGELAGLFPSSRSLFSVTTITGVACVL
jgi:hypothetical protein